MGGAIIEAKPFILILLPSSVHHIHSSTPPLIGGDFQLGKDSIVEETPAKQPVICQLDSLHFGSTGSGFPRWHFAIEC